MLLLQDMNWRPRGSTSPPEVLFNMKACVGVLERGSMLPLLWAAVTREATRQHLVSVMPQSPTSHRHRR